MVALALSHEWLAQCFSHYSFLPPPVLKSRKTSVGSDIEHLQSSVSLGLPNTGMYALHSVWLLFGLFWGEKVGAKPPKPAPTMGKTKTDRRYAMQVRRGHLMFSSFIATGNQKLVLAKIGIYRQKIGPRVSVSGVNGPKMVSDAFMASAVSKKDERL